MNTALAPRFREVQAICPRCGELRSRKALCPDAEPAALLPKGFLKACLVALLLAGMLLYPLTAGVPRFKERNSAPEATGSYYTGSNAQTRRAKRAAKHGHQRELSAREKVLLALALAVLR